MSNVFNIWITLMFIGVMLILLNSFELLKETASDQLIKEIANGEKYQTHPYLGNSTTRENNLVFNRLDSALNSESFILLKGDIQNSQEVMMP